jgi:hypothetical protein
MDLALQGIVAQRAETAPARKPRRGGLNLEIGPSCALSCWRRVPGRRVGRGARPARQGERWRAGTLSHSHLVSLAIDGSLDAGDPEKKERHADEWPYEHDRRCGASSWSLAAERCSSLPRRRCEARALRARDLDLGGVARARSRAGQGGTMTLDDDCGSGLTSRGEVAATALRSFLRAVSRPPDVA